MLITFTTKAHADVVMIGDVARELIRLMGKSDALPSAMGPEDIPRALVRLQSGLANHEAASAEENPDSDEDVVQIHTRALPLIELLTDALDAQVPVMWQAGARKY